MWLAVVYAFNVLDYYAGLAAALWDMQHPAANPACTGDLLCEHRGRHKRGCFTAHDPDTAHQEVIELYDGLERTTASLVAAFVQPVTLSQVWRTINKI